MERLVAKYALKLVECGLADPDSVLVGGLDADLAWNRPDPLIPELEKIFAGLNINSLAWARLSEPYRSIIDNLGRETQGPIRPSDCETRTFLHDLPVIERFDPDRMIQVLKKRKSVIVREPEIAAAAFGSVSPEQCFVTLSSVCFASFVKYFSDHLQKLKSGTVSTEEIQEFERIRELVPPLRTDAPELIRGPFSSESEVRAAMSQAGAKTVEYGLVDSYFGNISCLYDQTLYISQTGSALDELESCIDPCPLDDSSCAGLTASSELTAHLEIVNNTQNRVILHGHPKFSVILSLDCDRKDCAFRGKCHTSCPEKRMIGDIPVVPGEVGTGPFGLCRTLPPAMAGNRGAIVYGHGLFTAAGTDFNQAFASLLEVENMCAREYFARVERYGRV